MKLCHLRMAQRTVDERARLIALRDRGELTGFLRAPAASGYTDLDETMLALIKPVVVTELDRRIAECDADLARYGVELD